MHAWIVAGLGLMPWIAVADYSRGVCRVDETTPLPKAVCGLPSCPTGNDCQPPVVERTARVEYGEPLLRWMDRCPEKEVSAAGCWEAYLDLRMSIGAADPSGVARVGAQIALDTPARRIFRRLWGAAEAKGSDGRFALAYTMTLHVPAGQTIEVSVLELCARDTRDNEGCVLPARKSGAREVAAPTPGASLPARPLLPPAGD